MFVLGHLGIGKRMVDLLRVELPARFVLLGTLLPDLIDKPLYYALTLWTGRTGADVGLISGTRTFGHSGLLLIAVAAVWRFRARAASPRAGRAWLALWLGMVTHVLLDLVGDTYTYNTNLGPAWGTLYSLFYPLWDHGRFYALPHATPGAYFAASATNYFAIAGEGVGAWLLASAWLAHRRAARTRSAPRST
jgi:membrane-bound metal-dependent hydrolase YbcI (DUF457 family)